MDMNPLPHNETVSRHAPAIRGNEKRARSAVAATTPGSMTDLAKQIIRQQWPLRNHADPLRRGQARSLIRTHVILLRTWCESNARVPTTLPLSR